MLRCSFEFISSTFEFKLIVTEFSLHISFSSRKIFGFAVSVIFRSVVRFWCLLRFLCVFALGFRFPVYGKNKIRFSDLLFVAVWCFSVFASDNTRLNRVHVFSVSILIEIYFGFLLSFVRFCGFLYTPMLHSPRNYPFRNWRSVSPPQTICTLVCILSVSAEKKQVPTRNTS